MAHKQFVIEGLGLCKSYGGKEVLRAENVAVSNGRITGIMGPSGAGKSTLLRIMSLLEAPSGGELSLFGSLVPVNRAERQALLRRMTIVFQKPVLFDTTVFDNIAFGLRARRLPAGEIRTRVTASLKKIGLSGQGNQKARTLSGGEAQRVALARALVIEPEILFLDEPTSNLDPANVELLEGLLHDLNRERGTTIVMVTHNLFQARRLADDLLFLCQGELVEAGPAERVFQEPADMRTKAFVEGRMIY